MNVLYVWELPYQVGHLVFDVFAEDANASEHNCVVNRRHRFKPRAGKKCHLFGQRDRGRQEAAGAKEKAAEAASTYVIDIPSLGASLHKRPTDHIDRAYRRRPGYSNSAGSRSTYLVRHRSSRNSAGSAGGSRGAGNNRSRSSLAPER